MSFCRKCGNKIQQNEMFCSNCGAPVNGIPEERIRQANNIELDKAKKILKSFIGSPVDRICECIQNIEKGTLAIIIVFFSIIYGLLFYFNVKLVICCITKALNGDMDKLRYLESMNTKFGITFINLFGYGVMIFILSIIIIFLLIYVITQYLFDVKQEPLKLLGGVIFSTIPFALLLLFGEILGIISYAFTITCMVPGFIMSIVCLLKITCKIGSLDVEHGIYITSLNVVAIVLVNTIFIRGTLFNILSDALKNLLD